MKDNNNEKKKIILIVSCFAILILLVGITYSIINFVFTGDREHKVELKGLSFSYEEGVNGLNITNAEPMSDVDGIASGNDYTFSITSTSSRTQNINYFLYLDTDLESTLPNNAVKIFLDNLSNTNEVGPTLISDLSLKEENSYYLLEDTLSFYGETVTRTHNYKLTIWVDENYTDMVKQTTVNNEQSTTIGGDTFLFKINVATGVIPNNQNLDLSNANAPELVQGMIPVYYDGTNWRKADNTNKSSNYKWYNYNNKQWANAVTVTETNRATITAADVGTPISMDDINTMWVWIPRYSYTINDTAKGTNTGAYFPEYLNPGAIDIKFINTNTVETGTAQYTGATATNYYTHPSFWWDSDDDGIRDVNEEKAGIWVAKFETSHNTIAGDNSDNTLRCTNTSCANGSGLIIKPDVVSLKHNSISNFFFGARSMQTIHNNIYGFPNNSAYDIHMIKTDEWGAVAYLTQSIYGRCISATSCINVYVNNSYYDYTGRSGGNVSGSTPINGTYEEQSSTEDLNRYGFYTYDGYLLEYDTNTKSSTRDMSKVASTTGNIYGIYDMSGGAFEYVMGNYDDHSGLDTYRSSGFNGLLDDGTFKEDGIDFFGIMSNNKYYNKYTIDSNLNCTKEMCGGHVLNEVEGWYGYSEITDFVNSVNPWFEFDNNIFAAISVLGNTDGLRGTRYIIVK